MTRRSSYWFFCVAVIIAGCAGQQVLPISYTTGAPAPHLRRSSDYGDTATAIAFAMVEELKLPKFETVLYIYPSLSDYKAGFVNELQGSPEQASASSDSVAISNCQYKKILVNGHWFSRVPWTAKVKTLAHEMTHVTQFALGKWSCREAHAWITEGYANWLAYRILDKLSVDNFASARGEYLKAVAEFKSFRTLPSLAAISHYPDWDYTTRSMGYEATYSQAFLAVEYLIERNGLEGIVKYLSLFEDSEDAEANFKTAFGAEFSTFEADFNAYFLKLSN